MKDEVKGKKKYNETNLVLVEGQGKTREDICIEYIRLIKDGFSITVEGMASYLRCTYQHVIDKIVPEVAHIRITEVAKTMLLRYSKENNINEDMAGLFMKRILFHKEDFKRYICENAKSVISYKRFYEGDFNPKEIEKIKGKISKHNEKNKGKPLTLEKYMQIVMNNFQWKAHKNKQITTLSIGNFPEQLYSQKDLMDLLGFTYKIEFYRHLDSFGINKIQIGHLVRYRKEEVEEKAFAVMYIAAFLQLKEAYGDRFIEIIQKRALEL